jgi:hypothetical protein
MRASLLHTLREPRHSRRRRRGRGRDAPLGEPIHEPAPRSCDADVRHVDVDLAVQRVRNAGGPIDRAFYTCGCGYLFDATVSTTVACPHCGADQAW